MRKKERGFSLIEILTAMAIIGILAAVVLVSMNGARIRARAGRAVAQLSGILPNLVGCFGNGGSISSPDGNGGEDVCSIGSGYGQWPILSGALASANYTYQDSHLFTDEKNWYFIVRSPNGDDNVTICCNSAMNSCENIGDANATCDENTTW